jgi:hypothetical protein
MKRVLLVILVSGFLGAMLAGCHAEAGGSVGGSNSMVPALH